MKFVAPIENWLETTKENLLTRSDIANCWFNTAKNWNRHLFLLCWPVVLSAIFLTQCPILVFYPVVVSLFTVFTAFLLLLFHSLIVLYRLIILSSCIFRYIVFVVCGVLLHSCWFEREYLALSAKITLLSEEKIPIRCTVTALHNDFFFLNKSRSASFVVTRQSQRSFDS